MSNKASNSILLQYLVEQEKAQKEYLISADDRKILEEMLCEINRVTELDLHYLAELDLLSIKGAGETIKRYVTRFGSEFARSVLLQQIVDDRVKDCAQLVYQMYLHFKESAQYLSAPLAIRVRYDNAFKRMKSRRIKAELLALAYNPRDAFYLPLTMEMLASWKIPELEELFDSYAEGARITPESLGFSGQAGDSQQKLLQIREDLRFTAIKCLKYYPSWNTLRLMNRFVHDPDDDVCVAAKKTLKFIEKHQ